MKPSPVQIILRKQRVTVEMRETGAKLAECFIGDDENVERIADILSAKRLPEDAMKLRRMMTEARRAR